MLRNSIPSELTSELVVGMKCLIHFFFYRIDIIELFKHFDNFAADEVIGVANDLTPHYFDHVQTFINQNPGTQIGAPGRFQVRVLG